MSLRLPLEEYTALCAQIFERDGWKCRRCGYRQNLHAHHIVYRSEQGPDESWNLITLCVECHDLIHAGKLEIDGELVNDANFPVRFIWKGLSETTEKA